jgi:hypothetical protein
MIVAPMPPNAGPNGEDAKRIAYQRRSRRILYGEHEADIHDRMALMISHVRREAWGQLDTASNPFKVLWTELATLYDRAPTVTNDVADASELAQRASEQHLWPLMARVQRDVLALREHWIRVDVTGLPGQTQPVYEPVPPDLTIAFDAADRPGVPVRVVHARLREVEGKLVWAWDDLDLRDPSKPVYRVLAVAKEGEEHRDISTAAGVTGWPDRWRDAAGLPVLPYVLYHAARTPHLWDAYQTRELVEGTLNLAVLRTFLLHVSRSAAWRQRYAINVRVHGLTTEGPVGAERSAVVTDPATVLMLEQTDEQHTPSVGSWDLPVSPADIWAVIESYERKLQAETGISVADLERGSSDPRSGLALTVNRDAKREAQRRFEPQFAAGDQEVLRLTAIMLNRVESKAYPEGGYRLTYHGIPQSAVERQALREHLLALLQSGLIDPVTAYQELHPGVTDDQAMTALRAIAKIRAELAAPPPPDNPTEV